MNKYNLISGEFVSPAISGSEPKKVAIQILSAYKESNHTAELGEITMLECNNGEDAVFFETQHLLGQI